MLLEEYATEASVKTTARKYTPGMEYYDVDLQDVVPATTQRQTAEAFARYLLSTRDDAVIHKIVHADEFWRHFAFHDATRDADWNEICADAIESEQEYLDNL